MNKKQWYALGFVFLIFFVLTQITYTRMVSRGANEIHIAVCWLLWCLYSTAMIACWVCGWLEKEEGE